MKINQIIVENFDGEYDDEAGMAQTNLHTIARAAQGLLDTIDDKENLPEWVQEKIAKVEGMMVTAWDYLLSQEEQGTDPQMMEAASAAQQAAIAISMKKAGKKPKNESAELEEEFDLIESIIERLAAHNGVDAEVIWEDLETLTEDELYAFAVTSEPIMEGSKQSPEKEIERLKLRQDAEHGGASLKRQAQTQDRIRKLEKQTKDKQGVAEGSESDAYGNTGEKHECGSCDGTGIVSYDELAKAAEYDDVCPECGGKGWVRDKESFKKQGVAEGKESDPVTDAVISFYKPVVNDIHKEKVDNYVDQARELLQKTNDPSVRSKLIDIFKKGKENPYMQGGIVTTVGALLAGGVLSTAQNMGLSPAQTNLALQAILNTVIPTVVSRINGKNWSDTIKYTLASAGIGTGIAGAGLIEDDMPESMDYLEEK